MKAIFVNNITNLAHRPGVINEMPKRRVGYLSNFELTMKNSTD